jgi:hypothetical protein
VHTEKETRYSRIEKEALAFVKVIERLSFYLLGHKFELHIENKALISS